MTKSLSLACRRQRHLEQFNSAAKEKRQQQKTDWSKTVTDGKHPCDQRKGRKMLNPLPIQQSKPQRHTGNGTFVGRDNGKNNDCENTNPRQNTGHHPIVVD